MWGKAMAEEITWRDQFRYRIENLLARGPGAMIGVLAVLTAIVVSLVAIVLAVFGVRAGDAPDSPELGLFEGAWQGLMHAIDAGNLAGDQGFFLRAMMLLVTVFGIFIVSILIGTLTSGIDSKLQEMRKGRSRVLEKNYTLILGYSSKVYSIISELIVANASEKDAVIVILADRDKVEMDDAIRARISDFKTTRVICRSGNPIDLDDLKVVGPNAARSIIVLAPENPGDQPNSSTKPDIHVLKCVLALTNFPNRKLEKFHIVAELTDASNLESAMLVGGDEAIFVVSDDVISRITAQTSRQSGLSVVLTELLDFDGAEVYFKQDPALVGKTYKEAIYCFESSALIGLQYADGSVELAPSMDKKIGVNDKVIAISEDDSSLVANTQNKALIDESAINKTPNIEHARTERTLVLGWNPRAENVLRELDSFVAEGSETTVVCHHEEPAARLEALSRELKRQRLHFSQGGLTSRLTLDAIKPTSFDHVILFSDLELPAEEADAHTLITLLHLRRIADAHSTKLSIVSEMQDLKNRALAQIGRADDFIVSDKLISLMLSQLSENKALEKVFRILFTNEGPELCLRPISDFVHTGRALNFYTVAEAAARHGATAIGYRRVSQAERADAAYGIVVNPKKSDTVTFDAKDQLIVLQDIG